MIEITNIEKKFGKNIAVNGVSFEAVSGRVLGLIGSNGSGKSTLMRLISTVLRQDNGIIKVDGYDTIENSKAVRKKIGTLLGGDISLYPRLTARENIKFYADLQNVSNENYKKQLDYLVETLNMSLYLDKRVLGFSRGMRQKVAFARSMIHSPDIILLDEPSTGLDIISIKEVQDFILMCKKNGKTIVLTTHNSHEIDNLCDDLVILDKGEISAKGKREVLLREYCVANSMDLFMKVIKGE